MTPQRSKIQNPKSKIGRPGFSFVEVLFAVMILGIGFILIAGVFPVAIAQTQSNGDETVGAAVARNAVRYLESLPNSRLPVGAAPPEGAMFFNNDVYPFAPDSPNNQALWEYIKGNVIQPDDPRYGWAAFYRRGMEIPVGGGPAVPAGYAQVIVIACRNRISGVYDAGLVSQDLGKTGVWTPYPNLAGKPITVQFRYPTPNPNNPDIPDTVTVTPSPTNEHLAVAPGAFIVIGHDGGPPTSTANGWVVRIGNHVDDPARTNDWELLPGNDFKGASYRPSPGTNVRAYVVGQGIDPSDNTYKGGAQDVAVYTTFIQLQ